MPDALAAYPHVVPEMSYAPSGIRQKLASATPPGTALWVLFGFGLLIAGLAAFLVSPTLGLLAVGLPAIPLLVLFPSQALMLVIASVPFESVGSLGPPGSATITKLSAMAVMAGWVVHLLLRRQRLRLGVPGLLLVAYVAFGAVSCIWAVDTTEAFLQLRLLVQLLVLYMMIVNLMTSEAILERTLNVLIASNVVVAGLFIWHLPSEGLDSGRATLALGEQAYNPDWLCLTLLLPAIAAMALGRAASFPRWWRFASLVPIGVAVVLTAARNGGLALSIGFLFLAFMRPRFGIRILGFLLVGVFALVLITPKAYLEKVQQRYNTTVEDRGSGRLDIWAVGMAMIRDRPFHGTGLGGFQPAFYRHMADVVVDPGWAVENSRGGRGSHNLYLNSIAELGIFGAAILFAALAAHFTCAFSAFRRSQRTWNSAGVDLSLAILGMFVALLVTGLTADINLSKTAWLVLALCQGTGLLLSPHTAKSPVRLTGASAYAVPSSMSSSTPCRASA